MSGPTIDETHDPARSSWVEAADGHPDFPIQNLPYGVFSPPEESARIGVAIGGSVLDVGAAAEAELLPRPARDACRGTTLNALFALPADVRRALRQRLSELLSDRMYRATRSFLYDAGDCTLHLPAAVGDYTDFYAGIHHAENVGRQFRPDNPLLPNYKHVPIGYHGRASSVRVSGAPVIRPKGQRKPPDASEPVFAPTGRLDYELELGVWIGPGNCPGEPIPIAQAGAHVAGLCLLNDWSARDMQAWEYQPLGPFLAKSFQTTVSPWVVTAEALAPFRIAQPPRPPGDPRPPPHLWDEADQARGAFALEVEAAIVTPAMRQAGLAPATLGRAKASDLYWTLAQLVAHHSSNGCDLRPGDLFGTGTISGPTPGSFGSLMETTRSGAEPITLPSGERRGFLEDGDEVILSARATAAGYVPIGFGPCRGRIEPAR